MSEKWVVFDLIGVLAEPSWRDLSAAPDLGRWQEFREGRRGEQEFWEESTASAYRSMLAFRTDRLALAQNLRKKGYRICIATNFSRDWYDALMKQIEDKLLFECSVISSEIGSAKPSRAFFEEVLKHVPRGTVFIDDKRENCVAADRAGLRGLWAYPGARIESKLDTMLASLAVA